MKLHEALLGCSTGQLRRVADAWGLANEPGTLRHELVDALGQTIAAGASANASVAALDDGWRVLALLVRAHGRHEADLLARRLSRAAGERSDEGRQRVEQAIARLIDLGLVYRVFDADGGVRRTLYVVPDEIVAVLAARQGERAGGLPAAAPADPALAAHGDVAHDLFALASALRREAHTASSRGLARRSPRTVAQLLAGLRSQSPDGPGQPARRWQFLLWVGQRVGWFGHGDWPLPDDERIGRLLGDDLAIMREALAGAGPESRANRPAERGPNLAQLHADALQILSEVEPGAWWPVEELLEYVGQQLGETWSEDPGRLLAGAARRAREAVQQWVTGRWHWLGLVDWGQTDAGWAVVAVNVALSGHMAGRPADVPEGPAPCELGEPRQLIAPAAADLAALYRCEPYLTYRSGDAAERRYDLTPSSVARGIRLGGDEDELLAGLARLLQREVPAPWVESITAWCRANSALRVEPRVLLVASDESALAAALTIDDARRAVIDQLSSRHALVAPDRLPALLTGLAAAGQPVEVDASLRVEPRRLAQAAALGDGVVESAWVALDVLRRLGTAVIAEQRDLTAALRAIEASLSAQTLEALERRARTIAALVSERRDARRRPQRRKRMV